MSLTLQCCRICGAVQYPFRDVCRACLSDDLEMRVTRVTGTVVSEAVIHRSLDTAVLSEGPLRLGAVASPLGIRVLALLAPGAGAGMSVELSPCAKSPGAIIAHPAQQA
ncbi:Zn-ribbon domain-containing OB-fold protein [Novosphingobium sp. P6W]|uniref:Zn-ribbon domain-containing OB-fold protein n=1 Tax=Novosphingobium sp. P6W TaxID=1609758 RepID=UPI000697054C|nr:zinc ribbon domain-containing protein [Novosphingobium sp. P6W]AXB78601.1 hypothetical protein TQ38_018440 [Novosphingobium sp. P6W]